MKKLLMFYFTTNISAMIFGPASQYKTLKPPIAHRKISTQSLMKIARNTVLGASVGYVAMKYGCWNDFFQTFDAVPFFHPPRDYFSTFDQPCLIGAALTGALSARSTYNATPEHALKKIKNQFLEYEKQKIEAIEAHKKAHMSAHKKLKKIKNMCAKHRNNNLNSQFKDEFTKFIKKADDNIVNHIVAIEIEENRLQAKQSENNV